jgi:hypothetical protein
MTRMMEKARKALGELKDVYYKVQGNRLFRGLKEKALEVLERELEEAVARVIVRVIERVLDLILESLLLG